MDRIGERKEYPITGSEIEILEKLTEVVRTEDPDFITGYNIDNFDLPRMEERSEYIDTESEMDRSTLLDGAESQLMRQRLSVAGGSRGEFFQTGNRTGPGQ